MLLQPAVVSLPLIFDYKTWYSEAYMKRLNVLFAAALTALSVAVLPLFAGVAHAQDAINGTEANVADVGDQIDTLWKYIDDNANKPDDQFYPGFVELATKAEAKISDVYNNINVGLVTDQATAAVATIKDDIGSIRNQTEVLRQAAIDQDSDSFESANEQLGVFVDTYNADIDAYNAARYGDRTLDRLFMYAGIPALIFLLTCLVVAWAWITNTKTEDVAREVLRRLRWYTAYAFAGLLLATLVPCGFYFWTQNRINVWYWAPTFVVLAGLLFIGAWYIKVRQLAIRSHQK